MFCKMWSLTLCEYQRLSLFEEQTLRRIIFGAHMHEVAGSWRKLHEFHNLYPSLNIIIRIIKARMRCVEHVAHIRDEKCIHILVGKLEAKRMLRRPTCTLTHVCSYYIFGPENQDNTFLQNASTLLLSPHDVTTRSSTHTREPQTSYTLFWIKI
jgi:hypothetical protein